MKFLEIYRFELWYQLRRPTLWIYFGAALGLLFLVIDEMVDYARTVDTILLHSPITVAELSGYAMKFGLPLMAALVGDSAMRDIRTRMDPLLFTTSMTKKAYLTARFLGTLTLAVVLMLVLVPAGLLMGHFVLGIEASLLGAFRPIAYCHAGIFLTMPNVLFATTSMWALVLASRQAMAAYAAALLLFVFSTFNMDVLAQNWELGKLVDPLGLTVIEEYRRSIPPLQASTALIPIKSSLLANRLLWLVLSLSMASVAYRTYHLSYQTVRGRWKWRIFQKKRLAAPVAVPTDEVVPYAGMFDTKTRVYQTFALAVNFYLEIIRSPIGLFIPVLAFYAFILIPNLSLGPVDFPLLLTTERVLLFMDSSALQVFVLLLISLLAGQLVWRERDARLSEISDAAPVPDSILFISKYAGLALVLITLQLGLMLAGLGIQIHAAYPQPDPGIYLQVLFGFRLLDTLLLAAVAMVIHILANQKYVGHLLVLLFYFYTLQPALLGLEHTLLQYGSDSGLSTSIFWSQRAFLTPWLLYKAYWLGWTLLLLAVGNHMWVRGKEIGFKERLLRAYGGLKQSPLLIGCSIVLIASAGSLIFYNTNILHTYVTKAELMAQQVAYEKSYGHYKASAQPYLTSTQLAIELYPEERRAEVRGSYNLRNGSTMPIDSLHLSTAPGVRTDGIRFDRKAHAVRTDLHLRHLIYKFDQPLLPGDSVRMSFEVSHSARGFTNQGINTAIMEDGSYFSSWGWLPEIGYRPDRELANNNLRRIEGLPWRPAQNSLRDSKVRMDRSGQENIHFKALIGTSAGQTVLAPGTLRRSWQKAGRQYFRYASDTPVQNLYHIYSARYEVRDSYWRDVHLRILHHPRSTMNLERFEKGVKASLDYFSKTLGPYQFRQLTFVENTDSGTGCIALPGSISYSTNFSLLNPAQDHRGFDLPFAVVCHEVAHQWWGHQLSPASMEGAEFLTESLAWYSALGAVEQTYGKEHLQNLLEGFRQEFLNPRTRAAAPLLQTPSDGFQAYRKGPLAMYALREYAGEATVNRALQSFLKEFNTGEPPFATSLDFYRELRKVTPDTLHYLLHDLFATNTFWELETTTATTQQTANGNWLLTVEIAAQKVRVNKDGVETVVPMDEYVELGVYGKGKGGKQETLRLKKHRIQSGLNRITVQVSQKPETAGIDPRHLLMDTWMSDNVGSVIIWAGSGK
jgi:ABC-2 type transport system permease protein